MALVQSMRAAMFVGEEGIEEHAEESTLLPFDIPADRSCTGIKEFRAISSNSSLSSVRTVPGNLCLSGFAENTQLNPRERCHRSATSQRVAIRITHDL